MDFILDYTPSETEKLAGSENYIIGGSYNLDTNTITFKRGGKLSLTILYSYFKKNYINNSEHSDIKVTNQGKTIEAAGCKVDFIRILEDFNLVHRP